MGSFPGSFLLAAQRWGRDRHPPDRPWDEGADCPPAGPLVMASALEDPWEDFLLSFLGVCQAKACPFLSLGHLPQRSHAPSLLLHFFIFWLGLRCGMWAFSSCGRQASLVVMLGLSCSRACGILVPRPKIEPMSPELEGRFSINGPPEKSLLLHFFPLIFLPLFQK